MAEEFEQINGGATTPQPTWWTTMQADYRAGMANVFLIYGNVADYVDHPRADRTMRDYLEQRLGQTHTVASFAPDQGITFSGADLVARESRTWFDQVLGIAPAAPEPGVFDAAAAIRAAGGEAGGAQQDDLTKMAAPQAIPLLLDYARQASIEDAGCPQGIAGKGEDRTLFPRRAAVIIERLDLICPPDDKARLTGGAAALLARLYRAGQDSEINDRRNLVILLAPSLEEVHSDLRQADSGIVTIEVSVPDRDQRTRYVSRLLPARRVTLDGLTESDLVRDTAGLNRRHIEDIAMRARAAGGKLTPAMVKARKRELIAAEYAGILEVVEPTISLADVGGHEALKAWLQDWVVTPALSGDPELLAAMPQGIMLSGPSGTGKTMVARALARALGWNFIFIRPENVKSSWVGESEKLWSKAMKGTEAMAPAVVFFDEIDQKVQRGGRGGSGGDAVENNMFGRLLEWMTEPTSQGRLLFVGATNEPQNVDPALKRPGRLGDGKLPLLAPETDLERASVLAAALRSHGIFTGAPDEPLPPTLLALGAKTSGWTQAEIGGLAKMGRALAKIKQTDIIQALNLAVGRMRPATADLTRMTLLALAEASDMSLVPDRWLPMLARMQQREDARATAPRTRRTGAPVRVGADDMPPADDFDLE